MPVGTMLGGIYAGVFHYALKIIPCNRRSGVQWHRTSVTDWPASQGDMTFLWIDMLWLLLAAPLLICGYVYLLHRRKKVALRILAWSAIALS